MPARRRSLRVPPLDDVLSYENDHVIDSFLARFAVVALNTSTQEVDPR